MKKIIAYLLVALMCVSGLAACGGKEEVNEDLQAAIDYVYAMYKDAGVVTPKDFERTAQVMIGTEKYAVEWTVDNETIKITVKDNIATIDVDEKSPEEVKYTLTATVKDADGNKASKDFKYTVPKYEGLEKIVKDAYALEPGKALDGTYTLEGVILTVDNPYDEGYKNVTVTIQVGDLKDMPIMCYRLKDGEGVTAASTIKPGDTITVTGSLKNYNGTIEFDAGCTLDKVVVGEDTTPEVPTVPAGATQEEIVDIAYTLVSGQAFTDKYTLTGVIKSVDTPYDDGYKNVTVTIQVGSKADKLIKCYRMKGDGADKIAVGDTITCTGILKNYSGTIEFDAGCTLDSYTSAGGSNSGNSGNTGNTGNSGNTGNTGNTGNSGSSGNTTTKPSTPAEIMAAAKALASGAYLVSEDTTFTLSGVVKKINTYYSTQFNNVTVTISVDGTDQEIQCYRMKGNGADQIHVGDKITVTGKIKNYNNTIEFDAGCSLDSLTNTNDLKNISVPAGTSPADIITLAANLKDGECLIGDVTLTGKVTEITGAYSSQYKNITLIMSVDGKTIECYRLKGDGAESIKVGDTIKVTGTIINYKGEKVEFTSGCKLVTE